ncbi:MULTISPECIES: hypothetical protein [unclassified Vibrio]|uniref:hypothetical protein n=1 Tax=unclassified Vibrio TaxID=2614977 RepID=UPI002964D952|nr:MULTISPECIES: hypothetical protein [unclassified Vibrio]MDW1674130.1 hypothetical protein [Vibrio sp. Vb2610]MDW1805998.1 hypothetical protein [Vibrio sp. Vb2628]
MMSSSKALYSLSLLDKSYEVSRRLPPKLKGNSSNSQERLHNITEDPLSILYDLTAKNDPHFVESKKLFDNSLVILDGRIKNEDFKQEAKGKFPSLSNRKALDAYSLEMFGVGHSQILEQAKSLLVKRFESNFFEINSEFIALDKLSEFARSPLSCGQSVIHEFEELAQQGHVFSQFMAGLLHTTMPGGFSTKGIPYLILAYENRFPRSMDALAEYLLYKRDYVGAVQCSLLSIDSLDNTKSTMQRILQHTWGKFIDGPMLQLNTFIFEHALDDNFKLLAKKHFPEFYPSKEELEKRMLERLLGTREDI